MNPIYLAYLLGRKDAFSYRKERKEEEVLAKVNVPLSTRFDPKKRPTE